MELDVWLFELHGKIAKCISFQVVDLLFLFSMLMDSRSFGLKLLVSMLQILHWCDTDVLHIYQNKPPNIYSKTVFIKTKFDGKIHWREIYATFFSAGDLLQHSPFTSLLQSWCKITGKYLNTVFSLSFRTCGCIWIMCRKGVLKGFF